MLRKRSEFPARNEDNLRKRFVTVWTVLVFGAALTLVLVGFFPERYLVDAAIRTDDIDSVKVAYLTSLLEKDPGNAEFRIELARQLKHFGEDLRALAILEPVADHSDPGIARRVRTMQFEILEKLAYRHPPESRERKGSLARMRRILFRLAAMTQDSASLAFLASKAEAVGAYSLAVAAADRLSHQSPDQEAGFYAKAARFSLFERDYRKAAHYRFQAMLRAKTTAERLDHYRAAVWILQSGRLHREALDSAAFYQKNVGASDEVLFFLARLGQAGNDPAYSQRWLLRLLRLHQTMPAGAERAGAMRPYDEGIYRLAFEIFLGTGNLEWARLIAERSVDANPRSSAWRMELARVAEWTNRPQVAEEQWLNAARLTGSLEMYRNVLRIALQLHDVPYIIEGYKGVLLSAPLDSAEWALMVRSYEEAGTPQMVIPVLETELRRRPHYKRFLTLAALYENLGEDSLAIVALDRAAREFGTNPALALHQARLLLNQADLVGSYRAAAAALRAAGPDDSDYWIHVGDLAWTLQQDSVALASYRMLVESGRYTDSDLLRLVLLARKSDPARAHDYAALGWKRFRIPTFFLQMVDLSVSAGKWKQARAELASITEEELPLVAWLPAFWIYRAQAAHQDGRGAEALDHYRQALVLDPGSRDLRANCLWLLVELGRSGEVREAVARWLPTEPGDPVLTPAFAAAFVHLGDRRNALRWLGSMYGGRRGDPHWLLYYADILAGAGYVEVAGRVRSEAWAVLARDSVPKGADPAEWRAARVRMALEIGSPEQGALAMRSIIENDSGRSREEVDMALSWFLSRGVLEPVKQYVARKKETAAPVPVWVEMALAMSDGNRTAVAALLRDRREDLGADDAVAAADFLRETRRARRWAFEGLERRPENDPLARRFQDLSARGSDRARLEVSSTNSGPLAFRDYSLEGRAQARPGLAFRSEYRIREITRQDTTQGILAPARAHSALLQAIWESDFGNVRLGVHGRRAEADATGISAEYLTPAWNDIVGRILLGTAESPDESWLLESAALRDRLGLEAAWTPTSRDVLIGQATWNRIRGGRGDDLFQGSRWSLAAEHRFRIGYPSLSSFLGATWQRYAAAASAPSETRGLIPSRNLSFDAGLAAGELDEDTWVRAFRPWFRTGVTSSGSALSTSAFSGWYAQGGMQGSLVGGDRTSVYLVLAKESFTGRSFDRRIGFLFSYYLR